MKTITSLVVFVLVSLLVHSCQVGAVDRFIATTGTNSPGCTSSSTPCATLAYAIGGSQPGDKVFLAAGLYDTTSCNINMTNAAITIEGAGIDATKIDCGHTAPGFLASTSTLVVSNLEITRGYAPKFDKFDRTGGMFAVSQSALTLTNVRLSKGWADAAAYNGPGGAIFGFASNIRLYDSELIENVGGIAGAIYTIGNSNLTIYRSKFIRNRTGQAGWGGAIVPEDNTRMEIYDSLFEYNFGAFGGHIDDGGDVITKVVNTTFQHGTSLYAGAYYHFGSSISHFTDCTFFNNSAANAGGAIRTTTNTIVFYERCTFDSNSAGSGGAFSTFSENKANVYNCLFRNNKAQSFGVLEALGPIEIINTTFASNSALRGIVYLLYGTADPTLLVFNDNSFYNNTVGDGIVSTDSPLAGIVYNLNGLHTWQNKATLRGCGLTAGGGSLVNLRNAVIEDNECGQYGAVYAGQLSVVNVFGATIRRNTANKGTGLTAADLGVINDFGSTIEGNTALLEGGAAYQDSSARLTSIGSKYFGNKARYGGAVAISEISSFCPSFNRTQFASNSADVAGGAVFFGAKFCPGFCTSCSISSSNTALYGSSTATRPSRLSLTTELPSSLAPSEVFSAKLELLDDLGQVVRGQREYLVQVSAVYTDSPSNVTLIAGSVVADVTLEGVAEFKLLRLIGEPGRQVTINFDVVPEGVLSVSRPVSITTCTDTEEPHQQTLPNGDVAYYCLIVSETTVPVQAALTAILCVLILACVALLITLIRFRQTPVIKRASPTFLCLIVAGGQITFVAGIMFQFTTDATCALRPWLLCLGFSVMFGSLFVKEWRILRVFTSGNRLRSVKVTDAMLARGVVFGVGAEFVLLIIWFAVEPYVSQTILDIDNQSITYQCLSSYKTQIFFWILLVFNAILILAGCILSFQTRNVPSNFNESKYIALSIYNVTLFIAIAVAIIAALNGTPLVMSVVAGLGIVLATTMSLMLIFIPKLRLVARRATIQQEVQATIARLELDLQFQKSMLVQFNAKSMNSNTSHTQKSTSSTRAI